MNLCTCMTRAGAPKRAFLSRQDAEAEIPGATAKIGDDYDEDRTPLHAYNCDQGWWHLGTQARRPVNAVVVALTDDIIANTDLERRGRVEVHVEQTLAALERLGFTLTPPEVPTPAMVEAEYIARYYRGDRAAYEEARREFADDRVQERGDEVAS